MTSSESVFFGVPPEMRLPQEAYSADVSNRVYSEMHRLAAMALRAGYCTIIDAVSMHPDERQAFAQVAREVGVPFTGIWLEAPAEALATRVAARQNDASDATPDIVGLQFRVDPGPMTWWRVNASETSNDTLAAVRRLLA